MPNTVDLQVGAGGDLAIDSSNDLAIGPADAALPWPWTVTQRYLDFSDDKVPPMGGAAQRLSRLGARWSCTFNGLPAIDSVYGPPLLAVRTRARSNGNFVALSWPQPAFDASAIGGPAVSGGNQAGTSLTCGGFAAGAVIPPLSFFSLAVGTRSYLYCSLEAAIADGGGAVTLTIAPMLRASPGDGAALEFGAPRITGFVQGGAESWTIERLAWIQLEGFTVTEPA